MTFDVVVALDRERGIGKAGGIPWRLRADLAHFRALTTGGGNNAVIMGRLTWESIPDRFRPLPNRHNLVVSRRASLDLPPGVSLAGGLNHALALAEAAERTFVIGGGLLYAEAIGHDECRDLYVTRVMGTFECDTFFPRFEHAFSLAEVLSSGEEDGVAYQIERWNRNAS